MDKIKTYNELKPRKLCKKCYHWHNETGEPWDNISGCVWSNGCNGAHDYLMGYTKDCQYFVED